jgi:voltage-gated potassium channel
MEEKNETKIELFQLIIIVLSIYVLGAMVVAAFVKLSPEVRTLLTIIDDAICFVFIADFFYRFYKAPRKLAFLKWGWIDLVSSIPAIGFLRAGRFLRLVRLLRVLRAFRSTKYLIGFIFKRKAYGAFTTVAGIALLMVIFSSIAILQVETDPMSNIKTAEDALWWAIVTITTVGYGDRFPVTTEGRIIASFLMVVGVGLFGVFTGFVASWFVEEHEEEREEREERAEKRKAKKKLLEKNSNDNDIQ